MRVHILGGCEKLQITAKDAPNLSETTDLSYMFADCKEFNSSIDHWNVSNINNMSYMFYYALLFNRSLKSWNVSNVKNMTYMFYGAKSFNQKIGLWNVSSVKNMNGMFCGAKSFNQPIGSWDVSRVINMNGMFCGAKSFNQPIGSWDVSQVSDMINMFCDAKAFNQDISSWNIILNLRYMDNMLKGAISFDDFNRYKLTRWTIIPDKYVKNIYGENKGLNYRFTLIWLEYNTELSFEFNCPICLCDIIDKDDWRAFTCHSTVKKGIPHVFHKYCIDSWNKLYEWCPYC
jgi:surface protein